MYCVCSVYPTNKTPVLQVAALPAFVLEEIHDKKDMEHITYFKSDQ